MLSPSRLTVVAIVLVTVLSVKTATPSQPEPANEPSVQPTPVDTASRFFSALKHGEVEEALRLSGPLDATRSQQLRDRYQQMVRLEKQREPIRIIGYLQLSDAAVTIAWENAATNRAIDLDPLYLVRNDNQWSVLFDVTSRDLNRPSSLLTEKTRLQLQQLSKWFGEQKPVLQQLIRQQ